MRVLLNTRTVPFRSLPLFPPCTWFCPRRWMPCLPPVIFPTSFSCLCSYSYAHLCSYSCEWRPVTLPLILGLAIEPKGGRLPHPYGGDYKWGVLTSSAVFWRIRTRPRANLCKLWINKDMYSVIWINTSYIRGSILPHLLGASSQPKCMYPQVDTFNLGLGCPHLHVVHIHQERAGGGRLGAQSRADHLVGVHGVVHMQLHGDCVDVGCVVGREGLGEDAG